MNRADFYAALRKRSSGVFGTSLGQSQVDGIEGILDAFATHGDGNPKTLGYALATTYHETGRRMVPVREGFAKTDLGARRAVANLAKKRGPNSAVARYSKPAGPYGHVYYGRGRVQETWLENYLTSSKDAGVDLVKYPDKHLDPEIDARILIRGLIDGRWNGRGKGIGFYLPETGSNDLKNARRTVNVLDEWETIAGYYRSFMTAIEAGGGVPVKAMPSNEDIDAALDAALTEDALFSDDEEGEAPSWIDDGDPFENPSLPPVGAERPIMPPSIPKILALAGGFVVIALLLVIIAKG